MHILHHDVRCLVKAAGLAIFGLSVLPPVVPSAFSQEMRAIKLVVPFPQGGGSDALARLAAEYIDREYRTTTLIENHPGAVALAATEDVASAVPDGGTVLIVANSFVINPALKRLNYHPLTSFEPVCLLARTPNVIVVNGTSEYRSLADLVGAARAKPRQMTMAFQGPGSSQHIGFEKLKRAASIDMIEAPFPGPAAAVASLMSGQSTSLFVAYPPVMEHVKAGRLRVLAIASAARIESLPDVPTVAENGFRGVEEEVWFGLMAPAKTPKDVTARIAARFMAAIAVPAIKSKLSTLEVHPAGLCGADFAAYLRTQYEDYGRVIQEANIKTD